MAMALYLSHMYHYIHYIKGRYIVLIYLTLLVCVLQRSLPGSTIFRLINGSA